MIVLVSLIVLLKGFPCFHDFSYGASHPYILIRMIFALVHRVTLLDQIDARNPGESTLNLLWYKCTSSFSVSGPLQLAKYDKIKFIHHI